MRPGWRTTDVLSMSIERTKFAHVLRHLYRDEERWDQIVPGLGDALGRAREAGCALGVLRALHPDCYVASESCRLHVERDHDQVLAPAYSDEMQSAESAGRLGRLIAGKRGWAFVGDGGVFVVVREVGADCRPEVKTAYRVVPRSATSQLPQDFFKAAVRKLRDKSSWNGGGK